MRDQPIPQVGSATSAPCAYDLAGHGSEAGSAADQWGAGPVAALSAAALRLARESYGENQAEFAVRAGLAPTVVERAEDGTHPVWALPYSDFAALADTVSALNPWLRTLFETAAACDLLLWCVLDGDQVFATDVLTQPGTQDLARSLLRLTITGEPAAHATTAGGAVLPGGRRLLNAVQVALLHERAAALATSGSPDEWVGRVILAACGGDQP